MALIILGKTLCPLCGKIIGKIDQTVATSHFIADRNDPLWRYSDAGFHKECFLAWEHREEFIKRFNDIVQPMVFGNGTYKHMEPDGEIVNLYTSL